MGVVSWASGPNDVLLSKTLNMNVNGLLIMRIPLLAEDGGRMMALRSQSTFFCSDIYSFIGGDTVGL